MPHSQIIHLFELCKKGSTKALLGALLDCDESEIVDERGHTLLCIALKNARWDTATALFHSENIYDPIKPIIISACQCNTDDATGIDLVLEKHSNINQQNQQQRTALMTACLMGHINKVTKLATAGANCTIQDHQGNTALIEAVNSRNKAVVAEILKLNPNINQINHKLESALMVSIGQKSPIEDIVKQLLEAGADPELLDAENKSIWLLAKQKHPKVARLIEKHLNNINQIELPFFSNDYNSNTEARIKREIETDTNMNPLQKPNEQEKIADKAITSTANRPLIFNKNKAIRSNKQEWFHAAKIGNLGGLNRMIIEGVDINCVDDKGCTALIRASGHSRRAVVSFLLQQNADIEIQSHNGSTALSSSIIGNCRRVAGLLLDHHADPNGLGPSGYSYATIAAAQWNDAMLSILYRNGADIFIINTQQQNLLHIVALAAEYYNNINQAKITMQFLLDHGINIDEQDKDGNTALMLLCGAHKIRYKVEDRNIASLAHTIIKLGASTAIANLAGKSAIDAVQHHKLLQTKGVIMNALSWNNR